MPGVESGCKCILMEHITEQVAREQKPEREERVTPISGNGTQAKELANVSALKDECT